MMSRRKLGVLWVSGVSTCESVWTAMLLFFHGKAAGCGALPTFVPIEADPAHAFKDAVDHGFRGALEIRVFDAEDEGSAEVTS